jgi:hypothetical protein
VAACHHCAADGAKKPSSPATRGGVRWMQQISALKCQGLSNLWISGGTVVPPPPILTWQPFWPLVGSLEDGAIPAWMLPTLPPDRPPRCCG